MIFRNEIERSRSISIFILVLFYVFPIKVCAEKEAKTPVELRLLEAVSKDSTEVVDQLIKEGVSAKITDIYGQSLLMFAAQNNNKELVKLLKAKGANPNYTIEPTTSNNEGRNNVRMLFLVNKKVIDFGIMTSDTTMVNLLIDLGAKLDIKNKDLGSAVAKVSQDNNVDMVKYLLKKGAKVSDKTGQFLVVWYILLTIDLEYNYNSYGRINKDTDFRIIKIWDDYGIPLDDDILTQCSTVRSDRDRNKIKRYMAAYREWVANGAIEPTQREQKKTSNSIPIVSIEQKIDSISNEYQQKEAEEKALMEQKQKDARTKEWALFIFFIAIIAVSVVFWNKISFYSKQLYDRFKQTAFYNRFLVALNTPVQPQQQPQQPIHKKTVVEKAKSIVVNKRKVDQPIVLPEKGWKVDDTINIEINYLTIEDMINPIRLANEHERNVREMIWYIRKIEIMSEEEKSKARFHKKEVSDTLSAKWKQVNPKFVRSIYKRSLVVILENYSQQDSRVNLLIKEVKSKVGRK